MHHHHNIYVRTLFLFAFDTECQRTLVLGFYISLLFVHAKSSRHLAPIRVIIPLSITGRTGIRIALLHKHARSHSSVPILQPREINFDVSLM